MPQLFVLVLAWSAYLLDPQSAPALLRAEPSQLTDQVANGRVRILRAKMHAQESWLTSVQQPRRLALASPVEAQRLGSSNRDTAISPP